jgi:hypothetical protein
MKRAFKVSLLLNLMLVGWIAWVSEKSGNSKSADQPAPDRREPAQRIEGHPQTETKFRWSQVESPDYRQYIDNLKAIGCPQQTVRDIITADVHSLYVARGGRLNREPLSAQVRTDKFQALRDEENSVLAALLGPAPDPQPTRGKDDFQAAHAAQTQAQSNVSIPLAFRQTDFSALNLSQEQFESVQYLRDAFQRELRDSDNERRSPEYLKQWQSAQAQNNLMLRGMLGTKLYEQIESQPQTAPTGPR